MIARELKLERNSIQREEPSMNSDEPTKSPNTPN